MVNVEVIATKELGDRSYIAHDGEVAVVVDPQRDIDRVEALLSRLGVRCVLVLETHVHNDYLTGGYQLAARCGAQYALSATDEVSFHRRPVSDGDELVAGRMTVRVLSTPGHTDHHLSYVVSDSDSPGAVFTGGSLLYGSVGRTDLVDPARTNELTHAQYRSTRRLVESLPDDTRVYPTHGFGSFCSAGSVTGGTDSTIGAERRVNDALTEPDEDRFVEQLVAGLTDYPAYYRHMAPRNRQVPEPIDLSLPALVEPQRLRERITAGEWVVDLRDRIAYAADHVAGTISIELGTQFATWLGWLIPWGTPLTLLGDTEQQVTDAQRQLVRIGIDHPARYATGRREDLAADADRRTYQMATFAELADRQAHNSDRITVLDVRRPDEYATSHIPGAVHVPLHVLPQHIDELPRGPLWVHCASGYRASIAASLPDRAGHKVVDIDDDYSAAVELAMTTTTPARRGEVAR